MNIYRKTISSPIGPLTLECSEMAITALRFGSAGETDRHYLLEDAAAQLREYFAGERREFDLPLSPVGTAFQKNVWNALLNIPHGQTASYGEIAAKIGNPKASRAVGMANNRNPLPIFIPCHRVVGAKGQLTGYAGGLDTKEYLLKLESGSL